MAGCASPTSKLDLLGARSDEITGVSFSVRSAFHTPSDVSYSATVDLKP